MFLGTYFMYLISPVYLGYYPIGFAQIFLLILSLIFLVRYAKKINFIDFRKIKAIDILIFTGYIVSIVGIIYSIFVWYAFKP